MWTKIIQKLIGITELPIRVFGPVSSRKFKNIEGDSTYYFTLARKHTKKGVSCLIRAKNEEDKILTTLKTIYDVFDEIIFIDNGSTDSTVNLVEKFSIDKPKIKIFSYPFTLSRIGSENASTDELSLCSFSYYSNWCISKCNYSYICKWDADMVLDRSDKEKFIDLIIKYNHYWPRFTTFELQTVYQKENEFYLSKGEINSETRIFPARSDVYFTKYKGFEIITAKFYLTDLITLTNIMMYEWKNTGVNEFSHWTDTSFSSDRKKLEWERYNQVIKGNITPENFVKIPSLFSNLNL